MNNEPLPAVLIRAAMAPDAPQIHNAYPGNINVHVHIDVGTGEAAFRESFIVREDTFKLQVRRTQ
jgi:hypothetical protein